MKLLYPLLLLPLLAGCPSGKCGDNTQDTNEGCDDGNNLNADGCEADCSLPACNNGILDPGEFCVGNPVSFATDTSPAGVTTADLNGDGHQDILTANSVGNSVSVLLGDGTGNFARQADIEFNSPAFFIVAGDFDGDQLSDFGTSLATGNSIEVFKGLGDGTFEPLATLTANNPIFLATGDFNNDDDQDIIASSTDGVVLFLNDSTGGFQAPRISFIGRVDSLAVADFDGGGNLDAATRVNDNLVLLLGDGIGNLAPQAAQLNGAIQGNITAGDFNGDQFLDLATAQPLDETTSILTNQAGIFSVSQTLPTLRPVALTTADLNQDEAPDIAIASDLDNNLEFHLAVLSSGTEALTAQEPIFANSGNVEGITTSDLNEDTIPDVILTNTSNDQLTIFLSQP